MNLQLTLKILKIKYRDYMLLNGNCKESFIKFLNDGYSISDLNDFHKLPHVCQNALIIDFFDNNNFIVEIQKHDFFVPYVNDEKAYCINDPDFKPFKNRTGAKNQAIIFINNLWNERVK